jgi:hypothetical protein
LDLQQFLHVRKKKSNQLILITFIQDLPDQEDLAVRLVADQVAQQSNVRHTHKQGIAVKE